MAWPWDPWRRAAREPAGAVDGSKSVHQRAGFAMVHMSLKNYKFFFEKKIYISFSVSLKNYKFFVVKKKKKLYDMKIRENLVRNPPKIPVELDKVFQKKNM